jgi:hypothetical protein
MPDGPFYHAAATFPLLAEINRSNPYGETGLDLSSRKHKKVKQSDDEGHRSQLSPKRLCVVAAGLRQNISNLHAGSPLPHMVERGL